MFEIKAAIGIEAPQSATWSLLQDVDRWWLRSNPDHLALEIVATPPQMAEGVWIRIRERIAGVPGSGIGQITCLEPGKRVTWESGDFRYRYLGVFGITVAEGVTWQLKAGPDDTTIVSAHVWARFPTTLWGRFTEWWFRHALKGEQRDYDHTMTELRFLKNALESRAPELL